MKKGNSQRYLLLFLALFMAAPLLRGQVSVQEEDEQKTLKEKQEQEMKEAMRVEEMEKKKQMLYEQHEQMRAMEEEYRNQAERMRDRSREFREQQEGFQYEFLPGNGSGIAVVSPGIPGAPGWIGQENQTRITLTKSFRETTSASKGEFEVEMGIRHFRCMINGTVRSGEIEVEIKYPDGKTFKELTINPSADINFSQSIAVKEENEKKYVGTWSYEIKAEDAFGSYTVQIQTY